jgi:glutamine amidotransferase
VNPEIAIRRLFDENLVRKNRDGWGIGYYKNGKAVIIKEPVPATMSRRAGNITKGLEKIRGSIVIAHIRAASKPKINSRQNTHPFSRRAMGRRWIFAHKGTIDTRGLDMGRMKPYGKTDSEHLFLFLLGEIEKKFKGRAYKISELADFLKKFAKKIDRKGSCSFMLSDSEYLIAKPCDTLYYANVMFPEGKAIIVSTRKIMDAKWRTLRGIGVFHMGRYLG